MIYCRKCGTQLKDSAKFCDSCGAEVIKVKQRSYSEKYEDNKKIEKEKSLSKRDKKRIEKHKDEKNPYIGAALFATIIAFILAIFPKRRFRNKSFYEDCCCCFCTFSRLPLYKSKTS